VAARNETGDREAKISYMQSKRFDRTLHEDGSESRPGVGRGEEYGYSDSD
jgi:hypothetical protein